MFTSLINAKELATILTKKNIVLIDCRFALADTESGRKEHTTNHIPNAIYAHLDDDLSGPILPGETGRHPFPDPIVFAKQCGLWGINAKKQVIVYDQGHGGIAARVWFLLKWLGHEKVAVLNGGWKYWSDNDFPTDNKKVQPVATTFKAKPDASKIVNVEVLEKNLQDRSYLVVDSRAAERYRGEKEPIDPVAGHIPNAISAPFSDNLGADGLFLSKEQLSEKFSKLLKNKSSKQTIFYCGSGVTACHNLLAMDYVGLETAKLFPGSWSEWITEIKRPIAITKIA